MTADVRSSPRAPLHACAHQVSLCSAEIRVEAEQRQQKLADLKAGRKEGKGAAQRRRGGRRGPESVEQETDLRLDLAQRERLNAISQHLVTAISGLNDMYACHADLEATRTVWQWVAHAPASSTATDNLRLLRELRQAQLARALCEDGEVTSDALHSDSDDEGGFAAAVEGGGTAAALHGIRSRLRVVSAFQSGASIGASKYSVEGGSDGGGGGGAGARLRAAMSRRGTSDETPPAGGLGEASTPAAPRKLSTSTAPLVTINESVGSDGTSRGGGADTHEGGASEAANPLAGGSSATVDSKGGAATDRAAAAAAPPFKRPALGDATVSFDMDIARAAVRSLIKPVWYSALGHAAGRRRSMMGRAAGGVRSISRVLNGSVLSGVLSGRSSEGGGSSTPGSEYAYKTRSHLSYVSGDSTTVDAMDSSGNASASWGVKQAPLAPGAEGGLSGPPSLASRRSSAPPMRVELEHNPESVSKGSVPTATEPSGDSKVRSPGQPPAAPPKRPGPPPSDRLKWGVAKVVDQVGAGNPLLDDAPSPAAVLSPGPVPSPIGTPGSTGSPGVEPSSRERNVAAARRFSTLVTAMAGVRHIQKSFRQRHPVQAPQEGGIAVSAGGGSPPRSLSMAHIVGRSTPQTGSPPTLESRGGSKSVSPPAGSPPGVGNAPPTLSPFGAAPLAHVPLPAEYDSPPTAHSRPSGSAGGDSKESAGALRKLKLASTKIFGAPSSSTAGGAGGSDGPPSHRTPAPGAGRAYVMQSDRMEVVAARAAVAAAIDSMSPAFQQLGAGLDSVARLLLKQRNSGKGGSGRSKLSRARTKLSAMSTLHSSSRMLSAERGDSTLSGASENSSGTPVHSSGRGVSPGIALAKDAPGHGTLSLGDGETGRVNGVQGGGSGVYAPQARAVTNPQPDTDSKQESAGGIGFKRGLPTVRSAAVLSSSKWVEGGDAAPGRPPPRHIPTEGGGADGGGAPSGARYKRLSQSVATAGARSRLLASAGVSSHVEGGYMSPDRMGAGEAMLPPPGQPFAARNTTGSTGNMSYERASAEGSWGHHHPTPGAGMESGRNSTDGNNSVGSNDRGGRTPQMQLAAPGGAVFGGNARGGAKLGGGPPSRMGPLSPTSVNAARMATLMGALDKLDASAAALADDEEVA